MFVLRIGQICAIFHSAEKDCIPIQELKMFTSGGVKSSEDCNEDAYFSILHLAREQLCCTLQEKLSLLSYN